MRGRFFVPRFHRPAVVEEIYLPGTHIDHGLYADDHARFQADPRAGFPVVGDGRIFVHFPADAVADQSADDGKAVFLRVFLHPRADVVKGRSRAQIFDRFEKTFLRHADKFFLFFADFADQKGTGAVAVKSVFISAQIDADDIPFADHAVARDPVHDLFVDGCADARGISAITEFRRDRPPRTDIFFRVLVQLFCRDAFIFEPTYASVSRTMAHGSRIRSISCSVLIWIIFLARLFQCGDDAGKHFVDGAHAVNVDQNALVFVIIDERGGLFRINFQAVAHRFLVIVLSLIQLAAALVAYGLSAEEIYVITFAAFLAHAPAAQSVHQQRKIDIDIDDRVHFGKFVKFLRLEEVAGKPVEKIALFAIFLFKAPFDDLAGDFIGNELPFIGIRFRKKSDFRTALDVVAENISRGNMRQIVFFGNADSLRALTRAGRAEKDNVHKRMTPFFLFQEAFIIFHHQLRLQLFIEFQRNGNDNQDTCRREYVDVSRPRETERERRHERDQREENRTEQRDAVRYLFEIIRRRLARTDTGNKAAVLLDTLGNIFGIELDLRVEEREREDQQAEDENIHPRPRPRAAADILSIPTARITVPEQPHEQVGKADDRKREDQRHDAAARNFDGDDRSLTAVHLSALHLLCVLHRNAALCKVDQNDECEDHDRDDDKDDGRHERARAEPALDRILDRRNDQLIAGRGNDADEDDHGNTVSDAVFGNALAEPHRDHRAAGIDHRHINIGQPFLIPEIGEVYCITCTGKIDDDADRLYDREHERQDTRIGGDLLFALFTLFGQAFEGGDADREQLHDDGCVDIRPDTEREQRAVRKRAARDGAHKSEKIVSAILYVLAEHAAPQTGNGNIAADPVYEQKREHDKDFFSDLFDFESVF